MHRMAHQSQEINTCADKNSFAHGFCKKAYDYDFSCLKIPDLSLKGDRVFFELQKPYLLKTMWKTSIIVNLFGQKAEIQMRQKYGLFIKIISADIGRFFERKNVRPLAFFAKAYKIGNSISRICAQVLFGDRVIVFQFVDQYRNIFFKFFAYKAA